MNSSIKNAPFTHHRQEREVEIAARLGISTQLIVSAGMIMIAVAATHINRYARTGVIDDSSTGITIERWVGVGFKVHTGVLRSKVYRPVPCDAASRVMSMPQQIGD